MSCEEPAVKVGILCFKSIRRSHVERMRLSNNLKVTQKRIHLMYS